MEKNYSQVIAEYTAVLDKMISKRGGADNFDAMIALLANFHTCVYQQIHVVLGGRTDETAKTEVLDLIRYVLQKPFPFIKGRLLAISRSLDKKHKLDEGTVETLKKQRSVLTTLYKKYLALVAYRSYKHFCLYMESALGEEFTVWSDTEEIESGYFYYSTKMVNDERYNFMERQLPTGYGKTFGNCFFIAYIFGNTPNTNILYICGNDKFAADIINNVVNLMTSREYATIFPHYAQFQMDKSAMFEACSVTDLKFSIMGANKVSLRVVTKEADTNGVRAEWIFLDDITQSVDMSNRLQHEKDINKFVREWFERNYSRRKLKIIASGTTYSVFDILSWLKEKFGHTTATQSTVNKFTKVATSDYIKAKGISVFVCVPLLDPETDESTYPQKISTESARLKRKNSYAEYMAMDNQTPLPPDDNPFYPQVLREYDSIPAVGERGRSNLVYASLDPKRFGYDFCAMPICAPTDDGHYLLDYLYDQRPQKELYGTICDKIIRHKVTHLVVERNTDEGIAVMLKKMLEDRGYYSCKITDFFTRLSKDARIGAAESDIKSTILFPKFGMYSGDSQMGKALLEIYGFRYGKSSSTKIHDDAIDALTAYAENFLAQKRNRCAKVITFKR